MISFFRVVRYYPDLVTGECVNVGVIAFDDQQVLAHVREDWRRVEAFGGSLSPEVAEEYLGDVPSWTPERAKAHESHYMSSLQFSEPCASTLKADELLIDMANRMLGCAHPERQERTAQAGKVES